MRELVTIKQLQEILQLSRTTVYNLRKKGMPEVRIGESVRFDLNEVREWINKTGVRK